MHAHIILIEYYANVRFACGLKDVSSTSFLFPVDVMPHHTHHTGADSTKYTYGPCLEPALSETNMGFSKRQQFHASLLHGIHSIPC